MLLSPFKTGATPSSLLSETEALDNSTHRRLFLLHGTVSLPLPPYKRRQEPDNPPSHLFPAFLWISLAQELTLVGAQVATATTPRCPDHPLLRRPKL
jgi:hypothetical protein